MDIFPPTPRCEARGHCNFTSNTPFIKQENIGKTRSKYHYLKMALQDFVINGKNAQNEK